MGEPFSPYVIRAARFNALKDAETIRAQAQAEAVACLEEAHRQAEAIRCAACVAADAARQEAYAQSQQEIAEHLKSYESSLADLSFLVARRLIDDLPRDEKLVLLVKTALADLPAQSGLVVRVAASQATAFRKAAQQAGSALAAVSIVECSSLEPEECVLQHEQGQTPLGVTAQLRALWQGAIS